MSTIPGSLYVGPDSCTECPGTCNAFGLTQYDCMTNGFFNGEAPLPQGYGYGIVVAFGIFFSVVTSFLVWLDYRYGGTKQTSEQFNTAGRSVKTGLIANVIVSEWTWAATLLQSSNVAWQYGVSGPFWYAAGATIQVLLFGILAVELKRKAPNAHTMLEIIRARWGNTAHKVFFCFAIMTNIIVCAMLILGGASVIKALTNMNLYAASILIPVGVIMYTAHGGLKATFMSTYLHTIVVFIALCLFAFEIYATPNTGLGSPGSVWTHLTDIATMGGAYKGAVSNNKGGSYMTMFSKGGFIFGIINIIGNFGTVFVDQAYWLGAIASRPSAAYKGYILGGLMWFSIPFTLATSLGLAAVALDLPITSSEAAEGLVPPAVAVYILGKSGAVWITIMLFMAVTSTGSAELIAVSSLFSYDLYRTYFNPKATGKDIIRVSRYVIVGFGLLMGVLAIILFKIGLSLGWVYLFMGIAIGGAVAPIYMALVWKKANANGAITGAICGLLFGITAWLVTCQCLEGRITIDLLGGDYPMLAGNLTSILSSLVICLVWGWLKPQNYDWKTTREIPTVEEDASAHHAYEGEDSMEAMDRAKKVMMRVGWGLSFTLIILWPLLALPAGVFSKGYFTFWVILAITWGLIATVVSTALPLWEARESLWTITRNLFTCSAPTPEEDAAGKAQPGDFGQQMFPAPSFADKMDKAGGSNTP
ncbi:urea-proton symporter DUR3-like [Chlorella sorokiniana]|uniref:Urea-proton symporter DUR3-like n=1 Tax=Chlorella sorokiniana TaxID=3076 RepID=A0A2P6TDM9_CHLSO|nr:urea-proton symporter DUR3-like [Chlorella sorokiniana]|eukprot:PRW20754.1 urea-proton symporter DUR3-like [Chlorella sorokiniana]